MENKKGFTLIELILYIAIMGLTITSIFYFLSMVLNAKVKNQTVIEVEQQGESVILEMAQAIRNATSINYPTFGTSSSTISLVMASSTKNPTIFKLSSSTLQIIEGTSSAINLTNNLVAVTGLTFKNLGTSSGTDSIQMKLNINYINLRGTNDYQYSQNFTGSASKR